MESVDQLAKKDAGLQPIERIRLVEAILYSLDNPIQTLNKVGLPNQKLDMKLINEERLMQLIGMRLKRGMNVEGSFRLSS